MAPLSVVERARGSLRQYRRVRMRDQRCDDTGEAVPAINSSLIYFSSSLTLRSHVCFAYDGPGGCY
jgi:hypothetical protein